MSSRMLFTAKSSRVVEPWATAATPAVNSRPANIQPKE
jgi:hypothetical protein